MTNIFYALCAAGLISATFCGLGCIEHLFADQLDRLAARLFGESCDE